MIISALPATYSEFINKGFPDTISYLAIAHAKTIGQLGGLSQIYPYQHLERWPIHYLVGQYIIFFNGSDLFAYRFLTIILIAFGGYLVSNIQASTLNKLLYAGLIFLNPYIFPEILFAPPMISDGMFVIAVLSFAIGLIEKNSKFIYIALFMGFSSRQTSIVFIPLMIFLMVSHADLRKLLVKPLIVGIILFLTIKFSTELIFGKSPNGLHLSHISGLYLWFINPDLESLKNFLESIIALILTIAPIFILKINKKYLPIAILGVLVIIGQPLMGGPLGTGANAARLMALSIPFLGIIILKEDNNLCATLLCLGLLMLNALHHNYSYIHGGHTKIGYAYLLGITFCVSIIYKLYNLRHNFKKYKFK